MVKVLKHQNATVFEGISWGTIDGWIDRSDPGHPKWKDAVFEHAERGISRVIRMEVVVEFL
jgi:hypothetical protein